VEKTAKALIAHWDWASEKGLMNTTSARLLRTASEQVLSIEEGWENQDVDGLDIEETFRRFQNLKGRNLAPQSLKDYKRRFSQAVTSFLDYVRDPSNWKGPVTERPKKADSSSENHSGQRVKPTASNSRRAQPSSIGSNGQLIEYPFPIRVGVTARISLPSDLTAAEGKRLANFIGSLAIDPEAS
jgi:hypothetical protein